MPDNSDRLCLGLAVGETGFQLSWSVNPTLCNLALHFFPPPLPHLSNEEVGLQVLRGPFQLEHSIILLSLCFDK